MASAPVVPPLAPRPQAKEPLCLTSPALLAEGFRHGFFTRRGGVSPAPFCSLNFAANSGDPFEHVRQNLELAGAALSADPQRIYFLSQVHGTDARVLSGDEDRRETVLHQGDATLSRIAGVVCGARSADCATLLMGDLRSGAVAAVHAGWRGTARGIVESALSALAELAGGPELLVAVGPHIEVCCFEVGEDVARELAASTPLGERVIDRTRQKPHVDLRAIIEDKLVRAGVDRARIDHVRGCTVCDPERFFSYRREGPVSGRMLSAIAVRGEVSRGRGMVG